MNDDDRKILERLRGLEVPADTAAADRFEALLAENAALRAGAGRVPVSWDECADWLEAGGVVWNEVDARPTICTADEFRSGLPLRSRARPEAYRLLPPPNLVAAPPGMDGGGFLGAGADVPEGWEWRCYMQAGFIGTLGPTNNAIVQCRPSKPARKVVEVPLTQLVGRVIEGETEPVFSFYREADGWNWSTDKPRIRPFPANTLDMDTGMVRVYAEGDA